MSNNKKILKKVLSLSFLTLFFVFGYLAILVQPNQREITKPALAYPGQCSTSNGYSCPAGKTCSCPESTFDWENNQDAGDCDCVDEVPNQESCDHTICPVGYTCIHCGGNISSYCSLSPSSTCSITPGPTGPLTTITVTGTQQTPTTAPSASCLDVKAYSTAWVLKTPTDLTNLRTGNQVYFCARGSTNLGSFNKAKFTINSVQRPETATARPGSTNEFCDLYTIPANTYTFNVVGFLNHVSLGWIQ